MQEMVRKGWQTGKLNTMYTYEGDWVATVLKLQSHYRKYYMIMENIRVATTL